jgi:hypothetical protein
MAIPIIGIPQLQYSPNAMLNFEPLVRSVNNYREGAIDAWRSGEIARAGQMDPEAGHRHLMSVGLPDQARAVGLYPLQRSGLEAEQALARARAMHFQAQAGNERAMAPWQRQLMMSQAQLARAQAEQAQAAGQRAREELDLARQVLSAGGLSPTTGGSVGMGGLGLPGLSGLSALNRIMTIGQ